jgi:hypothetical protein
MLRLFGFIRSSSGRWLAQTSNGVWISKESVFTKSFVMQLTDSFCFSKFFWLGAVMPRCGISAQNFNRSKVFLMFFLWAG